MVIYSTMSDRQDEIWSAIQEYVDSTGDRNPVAHVLLSAAQNRQWAVGAAQCKSILASQFSRRMMSDKDEENLQDLWSLFNTLRRIDNQPEVVWDMGNWVLKSDPRQVVAPGSYKLLGWKKI